MPKQLLTLNNFSGGINDLKDPRDLANNELVQAQNINIGKQGIIVSSGSKDTHGTAQSITSDVSSGYGLNVFESDYEITSTTAVTLASDNRLGLNASGNNFYTADGSGNVADNSGNFAVGDVVYINIAANSSNVTTGVDGSYVVTKTSTTGIFVMPKPKGGSAVAYNYGSGAGIDSGTIKKRGIGESLIVLSDADTASVDIYSPNSDKWNDTSSSPEDNPKMDLLLDDDGSGTNVIITSLSKMDYYSADGAIRASDGYFGNSTRVRWYGLVKRDHFKGLQHSDVFFDFYQNFNGLDAPTDGANSSSAQDAGEGVAINISLSSDDNSGWEADVYQLAFSFVYDNTQESLLYVPTSSNTFTVTAGQKVSYTVIAKKPYDERISGARVYFRPSGSTSEPWILLSDISLSEGARASLDSDYKDWAYTSGTTNAIFTTASVESLNPVLDTYETINGYPPTVPSISISRAGESWKTAVVCNRRSFVANVKVYEEGADVATIFGDRIMYSMPNRFDTFPSFNYIDVVKGDAEDYIKLESYADRLLAFKQKSMQIINVSSTSDANWFLESDVKHNGVKNPGAVFRTDIGVVWVNENGCYIYDGSKVTNLIDNKINDSTWSSFINDTSIVGYEKRNKQILVVKNEDGNASDTGDTYIYDVKSRAWTQISAFGTDQKKLTNFAVDYNGDLIFAEESSNTVTIYKYLPNTYKSTAANGWIMQTKDIDFGHPGLKKKIYAVYVTYKSDNAQTQPIYYATDGSTSFSQFTGNFSANTSWAKLKAYATPFTCQSLSVKISNPTNASGATAGIQINDIAIEYRLLPSAKVV
jgi:hypothetical protein